MQTQGLGRGGGEGGGGAGETLLKMLLFENWQFKGANLTFESLGLACLSLPHQDHGEEPSSPGLGQHSPERGQKQGRGRSFAYAFSLARPSPAQDCPEYRWTPSHHHPPPSLPPSPTRGCRHTPQNPRGLAGHRPPAHQQVLWSQTLRRAV